MKKYEQFGIFDFSEYADELSIGDLIQVNGGSCGSGCGGGGGGGPSGGPSYTPPSTSTTTTSTTSTCNTSNPPSVPGNEESNKQDENKDEKIAKTFFNGKWAWCLGDDFSLNNYVTDDYGNTEDRAQLAKDLGISDFHHGIDLKASLGDRINSIMDGKVKSIGYSEQLGNYVIIQIEGTNNSYRFAHCDTINVTEGQTVVAGQKVATVGNTGTGTGPHLHVSYDGDGDGSYYGETYADNPCQILFPDL